MRRRPSRVLSIRGFLGVVQAVSFLLIATGPPLWVLVVLFSVFSLLLGLTSPANAAIFAQVFPAHTRATGFALQGLATLPGTLIVFPLGGAVAEKSGNQAALFFAVPFLIVGAIVAATAAGFLEGDMRSSFASALAGEEWRRTKRANLAKLLVCRDVDVAYDGVQVLFGVDFDVDEGEIIALLGTNGAGKSTLLRAISGTTEAASGGIVFDGRDITHMPAHEVAHRGVIHMPGGKGVFPGLSVRENLLLGLWMVEDRDDAEARLAEVFEVFPGMQGRLDVAAGALSGGEQQQLSLAQAFMSRPKLLLIDELSLGLSPAVVGELLEVVREIHRRGTTIVIVEQSVNVALTLADKAVFMEKGEVKFVGRTADLMRRSDILRAVYVKGTGALTDGAPAAARRTERENRRIENDQARPVLEVAGLTKKYGGVIAVDDVSFSLREGESLGLIGPNGSGKTTTFDIISGYQAPDAGTVTYEGVDITSMAPEERARRKLVRRFQDARLFPSLTVFETILVALDQQVEVKSSTLSALGLPQARRAERRLRLRADRLIELLDLGAYQDKFVRELSTGLRRVADLACVLASEPRVLLLDEPSSGIAQAEAEGLAPLLRRIRFETGCSLLVIEHDMPLISAVADELIAMDQGVIVTRGTPDQVLNDERVISSYLGGSEAAIRRSGLLS
jgi:branched-chain amino acid transport system ATP-binding protein